MKSIKLFSLLLISSIISITFQSCSSSSAQEKLKREVTDAIAQNINSKETATNSNIAKTVSENFTETKKNTEALETDSDIQFIRDKFSIITNATNYTVEFKRVECKKRIEKIKRKFTKKGELRYLSLRSYSEYGCVSSYYYFWDQALIFKFVEDYKYGSNHDYMHEHRSYFKNEELFLCLEKMGSSRDGFEDLMENVKKAHNRTVSCNEGYEPTPRLQQLIDLDLEKAEAFFCN